MNYLTPGDTLKLHNGNVVKFIAQHPEDGACLIGEQQFEDMNFETFEWSNIVSINGSHRTPTDRERLSFLMPIYCGVEKYAAPRRLEMEAALATGLTGYAAVDWAIISSATFVL